MPIDLRPKSDHRQLRAMSQASLQLFSSPQLLFVAVTDSTALAGSGTFSLNYIFPGLYFTPGRAVRLIFAGKYTPTSTPTLDLKLKLTDSAGNVVYLLDLGSVTLGSVANKLFALTVLLVCRSAGATGTVQAILLSANCDTAFTPAPPNLATINTALTQKVELEAAVTGTLSMTLQAMTVESLNQN